MSVPRCFQWLTAFFPVCHCEAHSAEAIQSARPKTGLLAMTSVMHSHGLRPLKTVRNQNITLPADDGLIPQAHRKAMSEHRTLNDLFRDWTGAYISRNSSSDTYDALMGRLDPVKAGRMFTREEMNERR